MACNHVVLKWDATNPSGISVSRLELMTFWKKFNDGGFDSTSDFVGTLIVPSYTDGAYITAVVQLRNRFPNLNIQGVPAQVYNVNVTASHCTVTGGGYYLPNSSCTLSATPEAGYRFAGWVIGGQVVSTNPYTFTVTDNVNVSAIATEISYLTFTSTGASTVEFR